MPGVLMVEAMAQQERSPRSRPGEPRQARALRRDRRRSLQADRRAGDELELTCELERVRGPSGAASSRRRGRRARRPRNAHVRGHRGRRDRQRHRERRRRRHHGVGAYAPERVLTTATSGDGRDLGRVDRHAHGNPRAAYRRARAGGKRPRAAGGTEALEQAGVRPEGSTSSSWPRPRRTCSSRRRQPIVADALGARKAAAYDLLAGCTGFVYALSRPTARLRPVSPEGSRRRRRGSLEDHELAGPLDVHPLRRRRRRRGRPAGRDGRHRRHRARCGRLGWPDLCPGGRLAPTDLPDVLEEEAQFIRMNGAEVFASRPALWSARLRSSWRLRGHDRRRRPVRPAPGEQAHRRPRGQESGSRPGQGAHEHRPVRQHVVRLHPDLPCGGSGRRAAGEGTRVLMSAVGAGLTWGSVYLTWTTERRRVGEEP